MEDEMAFEIIPGLAAHPEIMNLELSNVRLFNNRLYPWAILIPRRENAKNMTFLSMDDRLQLMRETALVETAMASIFQHDQTNVAAIGNLAPQLHVHIVMRRQGDPDWPTTVWNNHSEPYGAAEAEDVARRIKTAVLKEMPEPKYGQAQLTG
jgi:diadenosine tetraphosphate (Ap4A) HIT family hydrolase